MLSCGDENHDKAHTCSTTGWALGPRLTEFAYLREALLGKAREFPSGACSTVLSCPSPPAVSAQSSAGMCCTLGDRHVTHFDVNSRTLSPTEHHPRNACWELLPGFTPFMFLAWLQTISRDWFIFKGTSEDHLVQNHTQKSHTPVQLLPGRRMKVAYKKEERTVIINWPAR